MSILSYEKSWERIPKNKLDLISIRLIKTYKNFPNLWNPDDPQFGQQQYCEMSWRKLAKQSRIEGMNWKKAENRVIKLLDEYKYCVKCQEVNQTQIEWFELADSFLREPLFQQQLTEIDSIIEPDGYVKCEITVNDEFEDIMMCRACLQDSRQFVTVTMTDMKKVFIGELQLAELYANTIGFDRPNEVNMLSYYICTNCEAQLIAFNLFQTMCRKNENIYLGHEENLEMIQTESIPMKIETTESTFLSIFNDEKEKKPLKKTIGKRITKPSRANKTPTICPFCGKSIPTSNITSHIKAHEQNKEARFECHNCGKTCKSKEHIRSHMMVAHMGYNFPCHLCPATFATYGGRRLHVHHKHLKPDPNIECTLCDKQFSSELLLHRHRLSHHSNKTFRCDICGQELSAAGTLTKHKQNKHSTVKFPCDQCEMTFTTKDRLRRHLRTHRGDKNYVCPVCEKAYAFNSVLRSHIEKHHPDFDLPPKGTVMHKDALMKMALQKEMDRQLVKVNFTDIKS